MSLASRRIVVGAIFFATVAVFYGFHLRNLFDFPNSDDFALFLAPAVDFSRATSPVQRLEVLLRPHNEHVPVFVRGATLVALSLFGQLDFTWLAFVGTLALLPLVVVLLRALPGELRRRPVVALPVGLLVFQPAYAEATQWPSAGIPSLWVLVFAAGAVLGAASSRRRWQALGAISAVLASLTHASGPLAFLCAGLVLVARGRRQSAGVWTAMFVGALLGLRYLSTAREGAAAIDPFTTAYYAVCLLGSAVSHTSETLAFAAGLGLASAFVAVAASREVRANGVLFGMLLFCLATAGAVAIGRSGLGVASSYSTPRYAVISVVFAAALYLSALVAARRFGKANTVVVICLPLSLLYWGWSYANNRAELRVRGALLRDSLVRWELFSAGLLHPQPERAAEIFEEAIATGIYEPPRIDPEAIVSRRREMAVPPFAARLAFAVEHAFLGERFVLVDGWAFIWDEPMDDESEIFLVLRRGVQKAVFESSSRSRPDVTRFHRIHFEQQNVDRSGFFALVRREDIGFEPQSVGVLVRTRGKSGVGWSETILRE